MLYQLTLNSNRSLLIRYTVGYVSDNNKLRLFLEVKYWQNYYLFWQPCICCAFADSSQSAITMLSEYSGSLAQHLTWMDFSRHGYTHHVVDWLHSVMLLRLYLMLKSLLKNVWLPIIYICPCTVMSLFLAIWHLGQDDKITLKLYTNVYIFKVTFNQERWQYVRCSVCMLICHSLLKGLSIL